MKFLAKVISNFRITIPGLIREKLDLKEGDVVTVEIEISCVEEAKREMKKFNEEA